MDFSVLGPRSFAPVLDVGGANWLIFKWKFELYMECVGLDTHFLAASRPVNSYEEVEEKPKGAANESTEDFQKWMDLWEDGKAKWKEGVKTWNLTLPHRRTRG